MLGNVARISCAGNAEDESQKTWLQECDGKEKKQPGAQPAIEPGCAPFHLDIGFVSNSGNGWLRRAVHGSRTTLPCLAVRT